MAVFPSTPIASRFGRRALISVACAVAFSSPGLVDPPESVIVWTFPRQSLESGR